MDLEQHWREARRLRAKRKPVPNPPELNALFREAILEKLGNPRRDLSNAAFAKHLNELGLMTFQGRSWDADSARHYVNAPVKTATVDRLMVDLLVGMEFAQYAQSTINAPHIPLLAPNVLKRNLILEWLGGRVIAAIMAFVGYAIFWGLHKIGLFPEDWLWLVGLTLTCLWLLEAAWGTIMLPKVWIASRKAKKTILGLLNHMSLAYASLASSGPISAQHVTGLLNRGTEAGVIWPGPLHVLMEDIAARGGRF